MLHGAGVLRQQTVILRILRVAGEVGRQSVIRSVRQAHRRIARGSGFLLLIVSQIAQKLGKQFGLYVGQLRAFVTGVNEGEAVVARRGKLAA